MSKSNNFYGAGSVVVPSDSEGAVRRLAIEADRLVERPFRDIDVIPDVITRAARVYGPCDAVGWRNIVKIHAEEKDVEKTVDGQKKVERRKWKYLELSDFEYISFSEVQTRIEELARGLIKQGFNKGDVFNIYAQTSVNWQLMSHACTTISATVATAYDTLGESGLTHSLNEPECVGIFTNADLLPTLSKVIKQTPSVRLVIYDGKPDAELLDQIKGVRDSIAVVSLDELRLNGRAEPLEDLEARKPTPDDVALIMYTSGSTGASKGVVLTHGNVVASIGGIYHLLGHHLREDDTFLAYLPLAHIFEYVVEVTLFALGMKTGYGRVKTLTDASVRYCKGDIVAFRPTIMVGVPQVWEAIRKEIQATVNSSGGLKKGMFNTAMSFKKTGIAGLTDLADLALNGVKAATGGRLRLALNGSAALSKETQEFFSMALVTMLQGYGMTESCATCAILPPELMRYGSVGLPVPCIEIKLIDVPEAGYKATGNPPRGEVCIRGPSVTKGYYKRDDLNTDENIFTKDWWFRTGDVGQWNMDGTLTLIGRIKNLIRLRGGEYIALEYLESTYKSCNLVSNVCVCASADAKQPIAIIIPHEVNLRYELGRRNMKATASLSDLCHSEAVQDLVLKECNAVGKKNDFKAMEMLEAVILTAEEWTPENGLVTAMQRVQRGKIVKHFELEIQNIFTKDGWFRTGDAGHWNKDGTMTPIVRIKNSIELEGGDASVTGIGYPGKITEQLRNQVSDLQRALSRKTDEFNTTSEQLSDSQLALHIKEKELGKSLRTIDQLRTKLTGDIEQLRSQVSDLQRALDQKKGEFDAACKQLSDSQCALHLKEKELEQSVRTVHQLRTEIAGSNDLVRMHEKICECEILYAEDRIADAVNILHKIADTASKEVGANMFIVNRLADFTRRCVRRLENLGDAAVNSKDHDATIDHYSNALSIDPVILSEIFINLSKVWALKNLWEKALADANKAIELDPRSPYGYESKRAALLGARRFDEAIHAYNDMLARLEESPDLVIRESRKEYTSPSETIETIRSIVKQNQQDTPLVLINTKTGLLRDLNGRATDFEADIVFKELVASTTKPETNHIVHVIQKYFQYATFSHTWGWSEPSFQDVLNKSVHELEKSPKFAKLAMFCQIALDANLRWAWSDTCCINKLDGPVLQESLTSMYKWYHNSALTVIHLMGVLSNAKLLRALIRCLWNTRAWTLQEFFASKVVRFYTEDWQIYLPDEITYNHKESTVIMAEMVDATGVDAQVLLSLRPGPNDVRQKLCLAAMRIATRKEDIAYSLFGIFDVSIPVTYGEGQQRALGRLLSEVLNLSGDTTILEWTGRASEYNSCLPAEITVYRELRSPYTPSAIENDMMEQLVAGIQTSSELAVVLYDRVIGLRSPRFSGRLLALPCMIFPLRRLSTGEGEPLHVYRAAVGGSVNIEIKTTADLSTFSTNLFVVHPWLRGLADPAPHNENFMFNIAAGPPLNENDWHEHENVTTPTTPGPPSSHRPYLDKRTRALRLFARLRQPFGGLLFTLRSSREFKRVASDHLITVQLFQDVTPDQLVSLIHTVDVV